MSVRDPRSGWEPQPLGEADRDERRWNRALLHVAVSACAAVPLMLVMPRGLWVAVAVCALLPGVLERLVGRVRVWLLLRSLRTPPSGGGRGRGPGGSSNEREQQVEHHEGRPDDRFEEPEDDGQEGTV